MSKKDVQSHFQGRIGCMITGGVLAIAVIVDSLARQGRVSHGRA